MSKRKCNDIAIKLRAVNSTEKIKEAAASLVLNRSRSVSGASRTVSLHSVIVANLTVRDCMVQGEKWYICRHERGIV